MGPDALLDIGSFLFSIAFFYFYFLKYIPYRLNFCRYSFSPVIIFVTNTKFHHFQPTKFSPIRYFNIVTRYLYVNFVLNFSRVVLVFGWVLSYLGYNPSFFSKINFPRFKWQFLPSQETEILSKCLSLI